MKAFEWVPSKLCWERFMVEVSIEYMAVDCGRTGEPSGRFLLQLQIRH